MPKRILIVEDQEELRCALARRFTRRGFEVHQAPNATLAIEELRKRSVDMVISDIDLNDERSGFDVFNCMKAEGLTVPFLFLTGHGEDSPEGECALRIGADAVLSKPVEFSVLLEQVCALLGVSAESVSLISNRDVSMR